MGNEQSYQKSQLRDREISILKSKTKHSESKLKEFYEEFKQECPSGRMNKDQFRKIYRQYVGNDSDSNYVNQVFNVFDQNGDGLVDFSEFVLSLTNLGENNDPDSQLDLAFELIDASGDGRISYTEMVRFLEKSGALGGKGSSGNADMLASIVFESFGLSRNDKMTKRQFIDGCKSNPDIMRAFGK